MARDIGSAVLAAAQADHLTTAVLAELDYVTLPVRATTADRSIWWAPDGGSPEVEFLGVGAFGRVSVVQEGAEQRADKIVLELSGVPSEVIAQSLSPSEYANRRCRVWLGIFDGNAELVGDPVMLFRGRIDTQDAEVGGRDSKIQVTVVDRRADWSRARMRRYSDAEQQARFPGDLGLQYAVSIAEKEIAWPEKFAT